MTGQGPGREGKGKETILITVGLVHCPRLQWRLCWAEGAQPCAPPRELHHSTPPLLLCGRGVTRALDGDVQTRARGGGCHVPVDWIGLVCWIGLVGLVGLCGWFVLGAVGNVLGEAHGVGTPEESKSEGVLR